MDQAFPWGQQARQAPQAPQAWQQPQQAWAQQSQQAQMPQPGGMAFAIVEGEQAAWEYRVNPGASAFLLSRTSDEFWIKSADMAGNTSVETYDFTRRERAGEPGYATKSDIEGLKAQMSELIGELR